MTATGFADNGLVLQQLQGKLDDFSCHGDTVKPVSLKHFPECQDMPSSLQEQLEILGCISNYHWGK